MNASRLLKIIAAIVLIHALCPCDEKTEEYRRLRELMGQTSFSDAREVCSSLILKYPTYVPLYEAYAEICLYSERLDEGERYFEARIREGRELGLSYFGAGLVEYHKREYKTAALLFDKSITSGVDVPECYNMFENAYEKYEGIEAASRFFSLLCHRDPENANHWYGLALAYWGRNDAERITRYIDNAIQRKPHEPRYLQAKAAALYLFGDERDARQRIGALLESCLDRADYQGYFFLQSHRISYLLITGQPSEAISITQGLLSVAHQYGYFRWEGWGYLKQADATRLGGNLERSALSAGKSRHAATIAHDLELTLASLDRTINVYLDLGKFDSAIGDCLRRVSLAQEKGYERHFIRGLMDLGRAYYQAGKYDLAIEYISESLSRSEGLNADVATIIQMRSAVGLTYLALGKHRDALSNLRIGLDNIPVKQIWAPARADLVGQIGRCLLLMGNMKLAHKYLLMQLDLARRIGSVRSRPDLDVNFGDYYLALGDLLRAERFFLRALAKARSLQLWDETLRCLRGMARVYEKSDNPHKAISAYSALFEILDHTRLPIVEAVPFHAFNNEVRVDSKQFIKLLLHNQDIEKAFEVSEFLKLRETSDPLSLLLRNRSDGNIDSPYNQAISIRKEITKLYRQLPESRREKLFDDSFVKNMNFRNDIALKELRFVRMVDSLSLTIPDLRRHLLPYPESYSSIQKRLNRRSDAILEYVVCPDRIIVFVVSSDTLAAIQLPTGSNSLNTLLANLTPLLDSKREVESIWNPIIADFSTLASAKLYRVLVAPVMHLIKDVKTLTIVPDDALRNLPFETLCMNPIDSLSEHDFEKARFLLERFEINYEFAATSGVSNSYSSHPQEPLLVIGNENPFSRSDPPGDNLSQPTKEVEDNSETIALPGVRREVQRIHGLFNPSASGDKDVAMSKEQFVSVANRYRVIHIASHFQWDDQYPLASYLMLPRWKGSPGAETLRAYEVPELDLDAQMIVLSGCNTARWSARTKTYGFIRGLLSGGTVSVIGSLWPIDDDATAHLMESFYQHLKSGCSNGRALQLAKIDMIRGGRGDPFYWGGFVLVGKNLKIDLTSLSERESVVSLPATVGISIAILTLLMAIRFSFKV